MTQNAGGKVTQEQDGVAQNARGERPESKLDA